MKILHSADLHLDSPRHGLELHDGAPVYDLRLASRRALGHLVDCAIDEAVDVVLIAGDVFDGDWPDYSTGAFFMACCTPARTAAPTMLATSRAASPKGATLVTIDANGRVEHEHRVLDHVRWPGLRVDTGSCIDLDAVCAALNDGTSTAHVVERYRSEKGPDGDGGWQHERITLGSDNPEHADLELSATDQVTVVAEFLACWTACRSIRKGLMDTMTAADVPCDEHNAMTYLTQAEVGVQIARLRNERGVSQRRLAAELGLDPSALSRVETGERGLAVGELVAIAEFLGVAIDELLRDDAAGTPLFRNEGGEAAAHAAVEIFHEVIDDFFALEAAVRD